MLDNWLLLVKVSSKVTSQSLPVMSHHFLLLPHSFVCLLPPQGSSGIRGTSSVLLTALVQCLEQCLGMEPVLNNYLLNNQ